MRTKRLAIRALFGKSRGQAQMAQFAFAGGQAVDDVAQGVDRAQLGVFCITPRKGSIQIKLLRKLLAGVLNPSVPV